MIFKKILLCILSILFSVTIFIIIGEIAIRIYTSSHTIYDIEMTKYANIFKEDSPNPLIGHIHKPNQTAKIMNVEMSTNSDGFRDHDYAIPKNNKYRIIFLGDSLTLGWGVELTDTFKQILEEKLNKKYPAEILNFGTGNYNTEQEVNLFMEKGLKYKPDKVVVFHFINDAEITPEKSQLWFLGSSQLVTLYWSRIRAFTGNKSPANNYIEYYSSLYKDNQEGWNREKQAFLQLLEITKGGNISLQVVLLPDLHNLSDYPFKKEHAMLTSFLNSNHIASLDLSPSFTGWKDSTQLWVAKDDAHPNKLTHKLIADYSLDFIAQRDNHEN